VLIAGTQGRLTVKSIFEQDARRYGVLTARGRLSQRWAMDYQLTGGDLYATWLGCMPPAELSLVRAAQFSGGLAFTRALGNLAEAVQLERRARHIVSATLWSALLSLIVLLAMVLAVPWYTAPQLLQVFSAVPPEYYMALTRSLFRFSSLVHEVWAWGLILSLAGFAVLFWSLPNFTGRMRELLDQYFVWRIYRSVHAVHCLALIAIALERNDSASTQLRTALLMQRVGASPWLGWHLDAMLARVDAGLTGAKTFDTGLLDRDLYWFFSDMAAAHGLAQGLALLRQRLKDRVLDTVAARARAMRWAVLLSCLAGLIGMALWHYAVIDELRRSLMFFYASQ
jgi:type II secretory pathway component PulF